MSAVEFSHNNKPDSVGQVSPDPGLGLHSPTLFLHSPFSKTWTSHDEKNVHKEDLK